MVEEATVEARVDTTVAAKAMVAKVAARVAAKAAATAQPHSSHDMRPNHTASNAACSSPVRERSYPRLRRCIHSRRHCIRPLPSPRHHGSHSRARMSAATAATAATVAKAAAGAARGSVDMAAAMAVGHHNSRDRRHDHTAWHRLCSSLRLQESNRRMCHHCTRRCLCPRHRGKRSHLCIPSSKQSRNPSKKRSRKP